MITEKIDNIQVQRVGTLINNAQRIAVISHISPDGDAMGSSHGLMHWLRSIGKTAQVILPNAAPDFLMWLPGVETTILYDKQPDEAAEWLNNADLTSRQPYITEGAVCHYTWYVPQHIPGLIALMGGRDTFVARCIECGTHHR